jgi:hypothetical protein
MEPVALPLLREQRDDTRRFIALVAADPALPNAPGLVRKLKAILNDVESLIAEIEDDNA